MAFHTAQTFTFGEQPSASKWQYIWDNDYALQDWSAFTNATFPIALMADGTLTAAKLATNAATQNDGWISTALTLTYASASTVTIAGDQTAIFTTGTRVKFTQTTVKYYVVVSSSYSAPNTTVTFAVNTDYTVANAAISAVSYSYCANPQGYPAYFNFTPSWTNLTPGSGTNTGKYMIIGNYIFITTHFAYGSGSAVGSTPTLTLPVTIGTYPTNGYIGSIICKDDNTGNLYPGYMTKEGYCLVYNAAGTYLVHVAATASVPFTWTTSDLLTTDISYRF